VRIYFIQEILHERVFIRRGLLLLFGFFLIFGRLFFIFIFAVFTLVFAALFVILILGLVLVLVLVFVSFTFPSVG